MTDSAIKEEAMANITNRLDFVGRDGNYVTVYGTVKAIEEVIAILGDRDMLAKRRSALIKEERQENEW